MTYQKSDKPFDLYQIVTEQILAKLDAGVVPWQKSWNDSEMPRNLVTKKVYRGINVMLLGMQDYEHPYWATFKQVNDLGGRIIKGQKPTMVVFWSFMQKPNETDPSKLRKIAFLRYYKVFNIAQCTGLKIPEKKEGEVLDFNPIEEAESIVEGYIGGPDITHGGGVACYSPTLDKIKMPPKKDFHSEEEYYSTLFHEMTHSTGHASRCNRGDWGSFGNHAYSKEELCAEFGAAMLCGHAGIENKTIDNSAAYIANWASKLRGDKKLIISASGRAQKAVDWIIGNREETLKEQEEKLED